MLSDKLPRWGIDGRANAQRKAGSIVPSTYRSPKFAIGDLAISDGDLAKIQHALTCLFNPERALTWKSTISIAEKPLTT